ncbi:MAG: restriction endonuclease subunit S [Bacteroidales bacterium]|nr:restriction endonuclease subunit S [Bacteroidales bacterium]NLK81411.1 restriction endonuclease subunit S [Bacteroidales bacterium]
MQEAANTYLKYIDLVLLENWSVQGLLDAKFNYSNKYEQARIGDFLIKSRNIVNIEDDEEYNRVTVKINNNGVILRDTEKGINIGTKKQYRAKVGQFIISKIDARNGAFGIIPDELDNAIVTNDFPLFDVNTKKINPQFLLLITTTKVFIKFAQSCSSGTTNRQRMDIEMFLNQKIPLPKLEEQEKIVKNYFSKIEEAERLNKQASDLESEIERYFLEQLGLKPFSLKQKVYGLQTVDYADLDRWDYFSSDNSINVALKKSIFPLTTIGQSFDFAKRTFNKSTYKNPTFKYIEIGAIDPIKGILEAKEIATNKAPSRATQFIKEGDLIIGTTRPYLKKFAIVSKEYDNDVCSSGFSVIASNENYHLPFLLQFLNCTYGIEQLKNRMTGGLYPAITEAELKAIKIPFPNVEKQIEIMELIKKKKEEILNNKSRIVSIKQEAELEFEQAIFNN